MNLVLFTAFTAAGCLHVERHGWEDTSRSRSILLIASEREDEKMKESMEP